MYGLYFWNFRTFVPNPFLKLFGSLPYPLRYNLSFTEIYLIKPSLGQGYLTAVSKADWIAIRFGLFHIFGSQKI